MINFSFLKSVCLRDFLLFFLCVTSFHVHSQVGTEFWFAAPEVSSAHGDGPAVFIITTQEEEADVTITIPVTGKNLAHVIVPSNSYEVVVVNVEDVENKPLNQINQRGIYIESSARISVAYEIQSVNQEKFILKGANALGTEFIIPSQTDYINVTEWYQTVPPSEKFDIVATEDGTQVTIMPSHDVFAEDQEAILHKKGIPFIISLDKGETYNVSLTYLFYYGGESRTEENFLKALSYTLDGTEVISNKPIAITISDDSIGPNVMSNEYVGDTGNSADLIGDQLIPVSLTGTEYIAIRTANDMEEEPNYVYVLATEDNTIIDIKDSKTNLHRGEQANFYLVDQATLIRSNKPIYVYQLANFERSNFGSAIIPPVNACSGSDDVMFTRNMYGKTVIQVLVEGKHKDGFEFEVIEDADGWLEDFVINTIADNMIPVLNSGIGDEQMYVSSIDSYNFKADRNYRIRNTSGVFHFGIMELTQQGNGYGFYTSYNRTGPTGNQNCSEELVTKLEEQVLNEDCNITVIIYPNPAKESFTINSTEAVKAVQIYNASGVLVEQELMPNEPISTSFGKGLFFVKVELESGVIEQKKLVIE